MYYRVHVISNDKKKYDVVETMSLFFLPIICSNTIEHSQSKKLQG